MNELPYALNRMHRWMRSQPWLGRFTLMNRVLLFMAFLPTGLVKASGQRFTSMPADTAVGFFFEAMFQTGAYWHFIGVMQMVAAVCLIIPATATLGALLFLPIIVSIVFVTWGIGFEGTTWITAGMLMANVYLLAWDADRVWAAAGMVIGRRTSRPLLQGSNAIELSGWIGGGLTGLTLMLITRSFLPHSWTLPVLAGGGLCALLVVAGWAISARKTRRG